MIITHIAGHFVRAFAADERASITVEWVFMFPLLIWTYTATFGFFNAFRAKSTNLAAAYTISDILSRSQGESIDQSYIDGLNTVFKFLTRAPDDTSIRVTSFSWSEEDDQYNLHWSHGADGTVGITQEGLDNVADKIPTLANGDYAFLLETSMTYNPILKTTLSTLTFENFVVTSMRFVPKLCFEDAPDCGEE